MTSLVGFLLAFCIVATALHIVSIGLAFWHLNARSRSAIGAIALPPVTIIRPVCGLDDIERETLASSFRLAAVDVDLIFCCASETDPAVSYLRALMAEHPNRHARLLIGEDLGTRNPKLNNIAKGWCAASHSWIILADSNLQLPPDYVCRVLTAWQTGTGLVSSPPVGSVPGNFWAELECAFLNTYQARWQLAADAIGFGFAQGKTMLWHKSNLDRVGGIGALAAELAEDAAATKIVRAQGLRVRLANTTFRQPLGHRSLAQILMRQRRWAQLRRMTFPQYFAPEVLTGCLLPAAAAATAARMAGTDLVSSLAAAGALVVFWLLAEAVLARHADWHLTWRSPLAWLSRDALIPCIWISGWLMRKYTWRGKGVVLEDTTRSASLPLRAAARSST